VTEIKTKKLTTAQRVRQIEEDIEEIRQVVSPLISEHQQLQQSLVDIVKEFDGRMIAMSSAINTMVQILTGPQVQQPLAPPAGGISTAPAERAVYNVVSTEDELPTTLEDGEDT
jgi:hypothetical protein|tara:strand:+ start:3050 stop:3391 length:342 start_codon:yes stop_codon:yes gene_type:complete